MFCKNGFLSVFATIIILLNLATPTVAAAQAPGAFTAALQADAVVSPNSTSHNSISSLTEPWSIASGNRIVGAVPPLRPPMTPVLAGQSWW